MKFIKASKIAISLIITMALCTSVLSGAGFTTSAASSDFNIENGVLTKYTGSSSEVTIPDSVTSIGNEAFYNCKSITSVKIPDSVTSIGDYAFGGCKSLKSMEIPASVTLLGNKEGNVFIDCTNLTAINVDAMNKEYCDIDGVLFSKDKTELLEYPCGKGNAYSIPTSVTMITYFAFYDCKMLKSVTMPDSVTRIMQSAFENCDSLTSVTIPDSVITIEDSAFRGCGALTSVTFPDSVTSIGDYAFADCKMLRSVKIPATVTNIGYSVFDGCSEMTKIDVDAQNCAYSDVDGVLFNKDKTKLIEYPDGKESTYSIPDSVTNIADYAFDNCTFLTALTIPAKVTDIGDCSFQNCRSLTIYGTSGTYAQTYAKNHRIPFCTGKAPSGNKPVAQTGFKFPISHISMPYGSHPIIMLAFGGQSTGAVTYRSSNPAVASVSSSGKITIKKVGKAVITATKAGDRRFAAAKSKLTITVTKASSRVNNSKRPKRK